MSFKKINGRASQNFGSPIFFIKKQPVLTVPSSIPAYLFQKTSPNQAWRDFLISELLLASSISF
jgi:hypothetical protein